MLCGRRPHVGARTLGEAWKTAVGAWAARPLSNEVLAAGFAPSMAAVFSSRRRRRRPGLVNRFAKALEEASARPGGRLVLAVHVDVLGDDFEDAYAWSYDPAVGDFRAVPPAAAADLFHEDTHLLICPWDTVLWPSVPALAPDGLTA